jgi:hypothetical protein
MNISQQRIGEAIHACLEGVPHDVRGGVCKAVQILRSIDMTTLPVECQDELQYILHHPLHSDDDIGEVAGRIAYLASTQTFHDSTGI